MDFDPRIIDLLVRREERQAQGVDISPEELCRDCPDLLDAVDQQLRLLDTLSFRRAVPDRDGMSLHAGDPQSTREAGGSPFPSTVEPIPTIPSSQGAASPEEYEILGVLGRGGMGVVYKAMHRRLRRVVALKMILAGGDADPTARARFRSEAEAMAKLQHPNIVQVFDVGETQGQPYFSLEFCSGGSLAGKLNGLPMSPAPAAKLVESLALAMQAAHEQKVVHRDLKPSNVLLTEDGTPKVTDFGLAKHLDVPGGTYSGAIMGTPEYMAPEQAAGRSKEIGPAADVYALGAILYECLTGRPPFRAANVMDTLLQVIGSEPVPPSRLAATMPRDLETISLKCLSKEAGRRYATARELAEDLRRFQSSEPIAARPIGRVERTWRWCRRNPAVASLLGLVAVVVVAGASAVSVLAVLADRRADLATEAEGRANDRAEALDEANRELESRWARGMLRVLEPEASGPLTDAEIDALLELAGTSNESVRRRFVEEAVRDVRGTRQLTNRAEFALHAVVGLDEARRMDVERILARAMESDSMSEDQRMDLVSCLRVLPNISETTGRAAASRLLRSMSGTSDPAPLRRFEDRLTIFTDRLPAVEAATIRAEAARSVRALMLNASDPEQLNVLAGVLLNATVRMDAATAAAVCKEPADAVLRVVLAAKEPTGLGVLAETLSALAERMEPVEGNRVCSAAVVPLEKFWNEKPKYEVRRALAAGLAALAHRMKAQEAAGTLSRFMTKEESGEIAERLARGVSAASARMPSNEAAALLANLLPRTNNQDALAVLVEGMSSAFMGLDPKESASLLIRTMSRITETRPRRLLADRLSQTAARMDAVEAADLLSRSLSEAKDAALARTLAELLARTSARLDRPSRERIVGEAGAALVKLMARATDARSIEITTFGLIELTAVMHPEAAATVSGEAAAQLLRTIIASRTPVERSRLADLLARTAARAEKGDAGRICGQAAQILLKDMSTAKVDPDGPRLVGGVSALSVRMHAEEAAEAISKILSGAYDPELRARAVVAVPGLSARLAAREAAALRGAAVVAVTDALCRANTSIDRQWLAAQLSSVADLMPPEEAEKVYRAAVSAILTTMGDCRNPHELWVLARGTAPVASRLKSKEAAEVCARAADILAERSIEAEKAGLENLAWGLSYVLPRMTPREADRIRTKVAGAIARKMRTTTDKSRLVHLGNGLSSILEGMHPDEAAEVSKGAAAGLMRIVAETTHAEEMESLIGALSSVAARMKPNEAADLSAEAAAHVIQAMNRNRDDKQAHVLLDALVESSAWMKPEKAVPLLIRAMAVADRDGLERVEKGLSKLLTEPNLPVTDRRVGVAIAVHSLPAGFAGPLSPLVVLPLAVQPLPSRLSTQELVDLLKHPLCVKDSRRIVLDHLGTRLGQDFAGHWEFVRFAERHLPELDLRSPPRIP